MEGLYNPNCTIIPIGIGIGIEERINPTNTQFEWDDYEEEKLSAIGV